MKKFDVVKTIQLILLAIMTVVALVIIFRDQALYQLIATDSHIRTLAILLWVLMGTSFGFLFYDFNSYTDLKRENIELDNAVYSDALTGIANRYSVDVYLSQYLNEPLPQDMGCVTIEMSNLAKINQEHGHAGGDEAIHAFSDILQTEAGDRCFIGRNGGNKFLAIFRECSDEKLEHFLDGVKKAIDVYNEEHADRQLEYRSGKAFNEGENIHYLTELVALSDQRARRFHE